MKKLISILLIVFMSFVLLAGCSSNNNGNSNGNKVAQEYTEPFEFTYDYVSVCLPANHNGNMFTDLGVSCMVTVDRYDYSTVAYHEYDDQGTITKKTIGDYTYDFQHFYNMGIKNWQMYVIRIAFDQSPNQMEHAFYRFIFNVYSEEAFDDAQVEKFMKTISFDNH